MAKDPETRAHQAWLGLLQPVGLVVSPPALVKAQAVVARNPVGLQKKLRGLLEADDEGRLRLNEFARFTRQLLGWEPEDLVAGEALEGKLEVVLPEHQEVLRPTYAVPDADHEQQGGGRWLMLVQEWPDGTELDAPPPREQRGWRASPQIRMERLLRDTEVPLGLMCTPEAIRMVVAPTGESSGHLTFPVEAMAEVGGRPILAALHMLLCAERMFTLPPARRLGAVLVESRKYQNVVSTQLAEQVLRALGELLRGFQAADEARDGRLLGDVVRDDPQHVYGGLITVLMRLVFLLYAEEREMLPDDPVYVGHYSVGGLFEKLRADAGMYPDTMDQRYGAWARLLSLFRLVFDGGGHGPMRLPTRHGQLFHPDEYPFLEGRMRGATRVAGAAEPLDPPRVSDGVVYRVLEDLLVLDGERLSYRSLDVEQIGSVYEAVMGFEVKRAKGASIGVRPQHVVVDLGEVLDKKGKARIDVFEKDAGCKLGKATHKEIEEAKSVEDVVAALGKKVSPQTPRVLPVGSLYLQPTEERRRSGSHYTPRSLTEPIVRTTLRPVLEGLGEKPTAEQILGLKVCDPAMGSGAFLVETCRHLAQKVVHAWEVHGDAPELPADEDALLHARRLVAQRCLYGVDRNPFAVNLAKLSLWLVTLAKEHAFTFLDHALKCGDSLVGLTWRQIAAFHWKAEQRDDEQPLFRRVAEQVGKASVAREGIARLGDGRDAEKRVHLRAAEEALADARDTGDLVVGAYFSSVSERERRARRDQLWSLVRADTKPSLPSLVYPPFHWEVEFSEIFQSSARGFHAFVGNPPFVRGNRISRLFGEPYRDWLLAAYERSHGNSDMCAYFFRRAYLLVTENGTIGFVATNSISETDTRFTGLDYIVSDGGTIFAADRNARWPGQANVRVSRVYIKRGSISFRPMLNGQEVDSIDAALSKNVERQRAPAKLARNSGVSFKGVDFGGTGFILEPGALEHISSTEHECIWPVINSAGLMSSPTLSSDQLIINFTGKTLAEATKYSGCIEIVKDKVLPVRKKAKRKANRERWWLYNETRPGLYRAISGMRRVLVNPVVSKWMAFCFLPVRTVFTNALNVYSFEDLARFCVLQCRVHENWALKYSSTLRVDTRYNPTDCFETFPFPSDIEVLEPVGGAYYAYRADLMARNEQGLTAIYNRFHDPDEASPDILELRGLHDQMDRAVLDAYGWTDIQPTCEFLLDYEEDEDEGSSRRRRKPWRYRWPDEVQEEVLARLLELNQERAEEEERLARLIVEGKERKTSEKAQSKKATAKKAQSKKAQSKKAQSKKTQSKKTQSKKTQSKKTQSKKTQSKKTQSKKTQSKKTQSKKIQSKKATAKKAPSKKATSRTTTRTKATKRKPSKKKPAASTDDNGGWKTTKKKSKGTSAVKGQASLPLGDTSG